jgi:hypothetical protein
MKRIAALAAVTIGLLAIPTAAMASTGSSGGSGPGYGTTGWVQTYGCHYVFHRHHHHNRKHFQRWQQGRGHRNVACPFPQQVQALVPPPQCTTGQKFTFSVAADTSDMTQVSGPQLSPSEEFTYAGSTYTIMSINPGDGTFTAFVDNSLFTNGSTPIPTSTGVLVCPWN